MKQSVLGLAALMLVSYFAIAQDSKTYDDGIAKFKAADYDGVIDLFSVMLVDPERNKRYDEDLYFYRGQSYYFKNQYDKSIEDLDKCLGLNHYQRGTIYWFKARNYDKQGRPTEAERMYSEALTASEKNKKVSAQILADRAQFHARQGNREAAQQDLAQAKALDPSNASLAKANLNSTTQNPASRTTSQDKKPTQVVIKSNSQTELKPDATAARQNNPPPVTNTPSPQVEQSAAMISSLAAAYKDEKRYALVIGNSNYNKNIGILRNPVNDATDISTELRKSNFEVQLLTNATYVQMREAMRKFQEKLVNGPKDQTVGLFYYAGHGVQFQDENYLVPIDASVQFEDDIARMCFPVQRMVLSNMENSNSRMNIVILDACRNNPFPAATRSVSQGLGEMKRARGSFIAYATAPGSVASDGVGRNGLYTQELLKALRKDGLTIEQVFKEVRMNVLRLSGEKQFTWDSSNIVGEFYFKF